MDTDRWDLLSTLFRRAHGLPKEERKALLDRECPADPEMRRHLEELLDIADRSDVSEEFDDLLKLSLGQTVELQPGQVVSRYRILEKLGGGGMGVVYEASDTKLDRVVALKFLAPHLGLHEEAKERFIREAKAASALDHPNICTILEIDETTDRRLFIAMPRYDGETLKDKVERGPLPIEELAEYAVQIVDALGSAHEQGIVHRDVKPANVMVTAGGRVKLLDFGVAKVSGPDLTRTGAVIGTVAYMSPEQIAGKDIDGRSDFWSLGVVLYEMLTGERPFGGENAQAQLYNIEKAAPVPLKKLRPEVPEHLDYIVGKLLRKKPEERYADADTLLSDLRALLPTTTVTIARRERHLLPYFAASIAVILAIAAIVWQMRTKDEPSGPASTAKVIPFTRHAGLERHPSFSPDGSRIAYSWNGPNEDNDDIYVQMVGTESMARITTDPAVDQRPAWSPDGRMLAFERCREDESCRVLVVPALGGLERELIRMYPPTSARIADARILWHPAGEWIIVSKAQTNVEPAGIFAVSTTTSEQIRLTHADANVSYGHRALALTSDGRRLLYIESPSWGVGDLYLVPLSPEMRPTGPARKLTDKRGAILGAAISTDDRAVFYTFDDAVWRLPISGDAPAIQLVRVEDILDVAISPDGRQLVCRVSAPIGANIWQVDLTQPYAERKPRRLIASTSTDYLPRYSPDGTRIAFTSWWSGAAELWVSESGGANRAQLTYYGVVSGTPRWSPDGSLLAFDSRIEGNADLFLVSPDGGTPRSLTRDPADDMVPSWSPDGEWIYFSSERSGPNEIWKIKPDGTEPTMVTSNGGFAPLPSPNGRYLYYVKEGSLEVPTSIWRMPVEGGDEEMLVERVADWASYDVVDEGLYYASPHSSDTGSTIRFLHFATGRTENVARTDAPVWIGLSVAPDRRTLAYTERVPESSDLSLISDF